MESMLRALAVLLGGLGRCTLITRANHCRLQCGHLLAFRLLETRAPALVGALLGWFAFLVVSVA